MTPSESASLNRGRTDIVLARAHMSASSSGRLLRTSDGTAVSLKTWLWGDANFYAVPGKPSARLFSGAAGTSMHNRRLGIAADTVEIVKGARDNGHPNKTISHWIAAATHSGGGGATLTHMDPSTGVWSGVSQAFSSSNGYFAPTFSQSNGIVFAMP